MHPRMKLIQIECNITQVGVEMSQPSPKLIEIFSYHKIDCVEAFKTSNFIKNYLSCQSIITLYKKINYIVTFMLNRVEKP